MKKLSVLFIAMLIVSLVGCASTDANVQTGVPINDNCALQTSRAVTEGKTAEHNGYTIGFCCDNCLGAFNSKTADEKDEILAVLLK